MQNVIIEARGLKRYYSRGSETAMGRTCFKPAWLVAAIS